MYFSFCSLFLLVTCVTALQNPHKRGAGIPKPKKPRAVYTKDAQLEKRSSRFLTSATESFAVNGSAIPLVDFNVGESYAGILPNGPSGNSSLWFWFFPSSNPAASNEIAIWLNGGPGCSSLDGLLQENGPFLWQSGTYAPVQNPYAWTNLTNMVWVDQPSGTGFSPGPPDVKNEIDVGNQFADFWKNFITTFGMQNYDVYLTGESYAGQYIPYIANEMLDRNDKTYYNVKGIQINDPSINEDDTMLEAPAVEALKYFNNVINLNDSFIANISARSAECGYDEFMAYALQWPPAGPIPTAPNSSLPGCDVWTDIVAAAYYVNPCFNFYHLIDFCPYLWDEMGFPSLAGGPNDYFNMSDVQAAIHAPPTDYSVCGEYSLLRPDGSLPSALGPLPSVIERTNNVIIGHGWYDFLLFVNGSLITIQNMTWNGMQGFQTDPFADKLFVPYHPELAEVFSGNVGQGFTQDAGAGYLGTTHTERGLTFTTVYDSGHEIPQYSPGSAYRQFEFLLGRINSLTQMGDFTTLSGNFTGVSAPSV